MFLQLSVLFFNGNFTECMLKCLLKVCFQNSFRHLTDSWQQTCKFNLTQFVTKTYNWCFLWRETIDSLSVSRSLALGRQLTSNTGPVAWKAAVVKVRGNVGECRSWAPCNCRRAFPGPTQGPTKPLMVRAGWEGPLQFAVGPQIFVEFLGPKFIL